MNLSDFPRDQNGIIKGQWTLYHSNATFTADLGSACFVGGVTTGPVAGVGLERIIAAIGDRIERAEPWEVEVDHGARSGVEPEARAAPTPVVPEAVKPVEPEDVYSDAGREQLYSICVGQGLKPDKRWGAARLREYLREHA